MEPGINKQIMCTICEENNFYTFIEEMSISIYKDVKKSLKESIEEIISENHEEITKDGINNYVKLSDDIINPEAIDNIILISLDVMSDYIMHQDIDLKNEEILNVILKDVHDQKGRVDTIIKRTRDEFFNEINESLGDFYPLAERDKIMNIMKMIISFGVVEMIIMHLSEYMYKKLGGNK